MSELYSVYYYPSDSLGLPEGSYEIECHNVPLENAKKWFKHHTTNVTAVVGLTARVIMTDSSDMIVAEWKYSEGYVWPKEEGKS